METFFFVPSRQIVLFWCKDKSAFVHYLIIVDLSVQGCSANMVD